MSRPSVVGLLALNLLCSLAQGAAAQEPPAGRTSADTLPTARVRVLHDSTPLEGVIVRAAATAAQTGADGVAVLRLSAGPHVLIAARSGFRPESLAVTLRPGADTTFTIVLHQQAAEVVGVIVSAARTERRIEDVPLRVEVLEREEIEEKMLMTPGDVAMMLNETSGLRVQVTSPSLGGAGVRIQGLDTRYTQILTDGLPLHGGQAGSMGLLQIPPMDLAQVEVIKGAASALYGAQALGGVVNLVSRRPALEGEHELLLNRTTRGGTDGVLWLSDGNERGAGYTLLAGLHHQQRADIDDDGWADVAGYRRLVARPRLSWDDRRGRSLFITAGTVLEDRDGGTMPGRTAPDGNPFVEALETRRFDAGSVGRLLLRGGALLMLRGSATEQRHHHRFGARLENDRHRTAFVELSAALPHRAVTWLVGTSLQHESYASRQVSRFDYRYTTASAFTQLDVDATRALALGASVRLDRHSAFDAFISPRFSALLRAPDAGALAGWTARVSVGTGTFAPTPFTEETEVTGLTPLEPLDVSEERAMSASLDIAGTLLGLEVNGTLFGSRVRDPLDVIVPSTSPDRLRLVNAAEPTRTTGAELLARWRREHVIVTGAWTTIRSTRWDAQSGAREDVPLVPRHAVGIVGMLEDEELGRAGVELYYTGRQALDENPYRTVSRPYVIVGLLVEKRVGPARLFLNAENLGDVRQTRIDPLVGPAPGIGGRWTTDAWTELAGRTFNGGVRWSF